LGSGSIGLFAHRFPEELDRLSVFGQYNVGWLTFRHNGEAMDCLKWWRDRCQEWCRDVPEDGKFADQKYLDEWPRLFPGTVVLKEGGAGLGPWNIGACKIERRGKTAWVDGRPLIFYHFHRVRREGRLFVDTGLQGFGVRASRTVIEGVYRPYLK